jgi:hypothetical protein
VVQHVFFLRRVVEYEAALLEHPPGTDVVVGQVGVQGPLVDPLYAGGVLRFGARVRLKDAWRGAEA